MTPHPKNTLRLRDWLSIPYLLEAESVELAPGQWRRRASYPELPGCTADAEEIVDAIAHVERLRVRTILAMLEKGECPPMPRPPLADYDPAGFLAAAGLESEIANLDREAPAAAR